MIDLDKIKEAHARQSGDHAECKCVICKDDRATLLAAVPDMVREIERRRARPVETIDLRVTGADTLGEAATAILRAEREIERLRVLAREGWVKFAAAASFFGNEEQAARVDAAMKEIEATS